MGVWRCWLAVAACCLLAEAGTAQEWTRFRGPNGAGLGEATNLPVSWADEDYNWKIRLPGGGHSSPVLWGERIFITCGDEESGARMVVCVDAVDGHTRWTRRYDAAPHRKHKLNSFASPTPVVDERAVYVCWGAPDEITLLALDHDGAQQWSVGLGPFKASHGFGVSPILYEDLVILPVEHGGDSFFTALDRSTGAERWRTPRESKLHYATPCLRPGGDGADELIGVNWRYGIYALDPRTGEQRWSKDVFDKGHIESSISSPVLAGDLVIGVCGWLGYGNEVIAVRPPDDGGEAEQVWRIARGAPLCVTPIIQDDLLFLWADNGVVTCADVASGKIHWTKRAAGDYYSSPVVAGGRLYNISTDGKMVVLAASREYQQLARFDLGEGSHATPAISGGAMYLRTFTQLMSIGGAKR